MDDSASGPPGSDGRFRTTSWSLVQAAGEGAGPQSREALATLCKVYWPPVYAYIRRRGHDADAARELTQGFFTDLLDRDVLKGINPEGGKFRSFLLTCVKHFLANEWDRSRARKRGGGIVILSLDLDDAESRYRLEPADQETPEKIFEKRWALSVIAQAMSRLDREMEASGDRDRVRGLKPLLTGSAGHVSYSEVASDLGMSEGAVKVAIHRLRKKFGQILREEVVQTLTDTSAADEEIRFLLDTIRS